MSFLKISPPSYLIDYLGFCFCRPICKFTLFGLMRSIILDILILRTLILSYTATHFDSLFVVNMLLYDKTLLGQRITKCQKHHGSFALLTVFKITSTCSSANIHGQFWHGVRIIVQELSLAVRGLWESFWQNQVLVSSCGQVPPGTLPQLAWGFMGEL